MAVKVNSVSNANVYLENKNMLGRIEEMTVPDAKFLMIDQKPLGLFGQLSIPSGGLEKLEGKIKWNAFYKDAFTSFANPFKALKLQVRSSVKVFEAGDLIEEVPLVIYLTINSSQLPGGGFKQNEMVEMETNFTASYMKIEYDGAAVLEIDIQANIFTVAGEDLLKQYRANLGI